jgi:uncharacterized protein (TIGR00369 family)
MTTHPSKASKASKAPSPYDDPETAARIVEGLTQFVPHNRALGIRFVSMAPDSLTLALPYDEKLVGNPLTGVLHGGAITALLDAACGAAVFVKVGRPMPVATLDLRIDYLRPATPAKEVLARAECFRVTQNVAFVRCQAFHSEDEEGLVAVANGTFTLFRGSSSSDKAGRSKGGGAP